MKLQYLDPKTLSCELDTKVARPSRWFVVASQLHRLGEVLINWLASGQDLKIYQATTRSGETQWMVQDPISGTRIALGSEREVRTYLEHRYYR